MSFNLDIYFPEIPIIFASYWMGISHCYSHSSSNVKSHDKMILFIDIRIIIRNLIASCKLQSECLSDNIEEFLYRRSLFFLAIFFSLNVFKKF